MLLQVTSNVLESKSVVALDPSITVKLHAKQIIPLIGVIAR